MIDKEHFEDWIRDNKTDLINEFIQLNEEEFDEYCEREFRDDLDRFV